MFQMFLDDLAHILGLHEPIPDSLRIDHDDRPMLALIQAPGLVHADTALQPCRFHGIFHQISNFLGIPVGAAWPGSGLVPLVEADKHVMLVIRHADWMRQARCGTRGRNLRK